MQLKPIGFQLKQSYRLLNRLSLIWIIRYDRKFWSVSGYLFVRLLSSIKVIQAFGLMRKFLGTWFRFELRLERVLPEFSTLIFRSEDCYRRIFFCLCEVQIATGNFSQLICALQRHYAQILDVLVEHLYEAIRRIAVITCGAFSCVTYADGGGSFGSRVGLLRPC